MRPSAISSAPSSWDSSAPCVAEGIARRVEESGPQNLHGLTTARLRPCDARARARRGRAAMAQKTRSGVAGLSSRTRPPAPNAAMASRMASRTEMASISGGSPTALLPQTTPGSAARSRKCDVENRRAVPTTRAACRWTRRRWPGGPRRPTAALRASASRAPCTKPPSIWPRSISGRDGIADVLQDVGAEHAVLAGEAVDLDLGDGGAVGEIVEGLAAARSAESK